MSKHAAVMFHRELDELFDRRTSWLRRAIDKGIKTKPKTFNRKRRKEGIDKLKTLATDCLSRDLAKKEFKRTIRLKKQWQCTKTKGWSRKDKRKHFDRWFENHIPFSNCIYVFWKGPRSEYVGRTVKGKGRPQMHFSKFWFNGVSRIDIYSTSQATQVPKLECLAIHRFKPRQNSQVASMPKGAKKCPVCEVHKLIDWELVDIFALK